MKFLWPPSFLAASEYEFIYFIWREIEHTLPCQGTIMGYVVANFLLFIFATLNLIWDIFTLPVYYLIQACFLCIKIEQRRWKILPYVAGKQSNIKGGQMDKK